MRTALAALVLGASLALAGSGSAPVEAATQPVAKPVAGPSTAAPATFTPSSALATLREVWDAATPAERAAACRAFRSAPASSLATETPEVRATVRTFYSLSCRGY